MTDRLKLSEPKGDAELEKIAVALEEAEYKRRYEQLKKNVHDLEQLVAEKEKRAWPARVDKAPRNKIGARKEGKFKAVSTAPSVNKTPAGPCMVPVAYPTSVDLSNSVGVARTVRLNGKPTYVLGSSQPTCKGDEQGSGGGVRSGTVNGEVKPTGASTTVRAEGSRVVREGDPNSMNGGNNPGIYVTEPAPHASSPKNALASSNPPVRLQTPKEKSAFRRWLNETVELMEAALQHPAEGLKGAVKGVANTPAHMLQLLIDASAQQRATDLREASSVQTLFGRDATAKTLAEVAKETQNDGVRIEVPKFSMSNPAQRGGDALSAAIQLFAGATSLARGAVSLRSVVGKAVRSTETDHVIARSIGTAADNSKVGDGLKIIGRSSRVSTKRSEAFFWSGRTEGVGGQEVAAEIAKKNGGTTLETLISERGIEMPPWDPTNPSAVRAWEEISAEYAANASGQVRAVIGQSLRPGNIWETREMPALMNNPKVTEIVVIDPLTNHTQVVFRR
jgi:hypothetical protein